jgi:hypothetical protein
MKKVKIIFSGLILISILSCSKEEVKPCNCGTIADDGITNGCYWLEIRNDCSGNKKKFCFDQDVWKNSYVGTNFCVTNEKQW